LVKFLLCAICGLGGSDSTRATCSEEECAVPAEPTFNCKKGHGLPPNFCSASPIVVVNSELGGSVAHPLKLSLPNRKGGSVVEHWGISETSSLADYPHSYSCSSVPAFLIVVPYSEIISGNMNYYHFHVDVLLPLFSVLRDKGAIDAKSQRVEAHIIPTVSNQWLTSLSLGESISTIDWKTRAFDDSEKFWMQALALFSDVALKPLAESGPRFATCFTTAHFGLPSVEHPSHALMKRFVEFLRTRVGLVADEQPIPCDKPDVIGFVTRSNRRLLVNEDEVAAGIREATGATVKWLDFGNRGFLADIDSVQDLRVLVGGQGSGLINGLYLPAGSAVVVLYQFGGWDVFEEYLKPRGPYLWWVNQEESSSFCNQTLDRYCDSPDTVLDTPAVVSLLTDALKQARSHCP